MKGSGITWDAASFKEFIKNPKAKVAGTKMIFQGLPAEKDEDDVWAYIAQFSADGKKK
jgi:cytochrome c